MIANCEVCGSLLRGPTIDLGAHPLNDDMRRVGEPSSVERYRQEIQLCTTCLTAHQLHPVDKETLFFPDYRYRGSVTKDVVLGMRDLVGNALEFLGTSRPSTVVDIGANDGSLLGIFKEQSKCTTIGVDPTLAVFQNAGRIDFPYQEFFSVDSARRILDRHGFPDIITFTNVFAHIENLPGLIEAVSVLLNDRNVLVIENHYLGSVLESNQFDTFYAEHLRTYSAKSFDYIARALDVEIRSVQFPRRYGGNIRVYMSRGTTGPSQREPTSEEDFPERFLGIQDTYDGWLVDSQAAVSDLLAEGPLVGKSCPARSVMLYSSLEMDAQKMTYVYEHPASPKIGFCVPGTTIPIVSDEGLRAEASPNMILWSWHIAYELMPYLKDSGYNGDVWAPLPRFQLLGTV